MIIKIKMAKFEQVLQSGFVVKKITNNIYLTRLYANKKLHPIGYHIPVIIFIKNN